VLALRSVTPPLDSPPPLAAPLPFAARFWLAWVCLWNVLFDGAFAARVRVLSDASAPLGAPRPEAPATLEPATSPSRLATAATTREDMAPRQDAGPALQLLALLQREGRFVDFLQQEIAAFSDAQIGQVARVVHAGCRKAMVAHAQIEPVLGEAEQSRIELPPGFDPAAVKLTGQVQGAGPYRGTLRHRGWRATRLVLPTALAGHDPNILAPAEVEL
jgi:hypothetical protein